MKENILLAELTKNCEGKKEKLMNLLEAFDLACLGYDVREQRVKDVYDRVLAENEFFSVRELGRGENVHVGDRVVDESFLFLLSDDDFDEVMKLARPILVEEKITDENGYFLEDWAEVRRKAREELVSFIVYEIIPESMRHHFDSCLWNVIHGNKLINAFKDSLTKAA